MEVAAWLRRLGFEQYEPASRESMLDLFCLRPFGSDGQGPSEFEQATAQGRIVDPIIGADQFDRLAPAQRNIPTLPIADPRRPRLPLTVEQPSSGITPRMSDEQQFIVR